MAPGFVEALQQAGPDGDVRKALLSSGGLTRFDYNAPLIQSPVAPIALQNLVSEEPVTTPTGTALVQVTRTNNAATVALDGTKPTSTYEFAPVTWKLATIATLAGPYYRQWLADFADLPATIASEAASGISHATETFIVSGGTAEDGTTINGILSTSGVGTQAVIGSGPLLTLRIAVGNLTASGVTPTGIALSPSDWTTLSTLKDSQGRHLINPAPADEPLCGSGRCPSCSRPPSLPERRLWPTWAACTCSTVGSTRP